MKSSTVEYAVGILALSVATVVLLGVFVTNGLSASPKASEFGFRNTTGDISDVFYTQVTPAGYTFSIWGVIYAWQAAWILYAWTFIFRPKAIRTIFIGVYVGYSIVNSFNIIWIYLWGNEHIVPASVILILFNVVFYPTIAMLFLYFYKVKSKANKVDIVLTYALPMNGLCLYTTWTTIASLINLTAAVQYNNDISGADMATVSLTILLVLVLTYFILENTILDKYGFRYVYSVYPVVVWALAGVLSAHWGQTGSQRNNIYTLVLLLIAGVMLIAKFALLGIYLKYRKNDERKGYTSA